MRYTLIGLFLVILTGCQSQRRVQIPSPSPVYRAGYAYQQLSATEVQIIAKTNRGLEAALDELCGAAVCTVEPVGMMYLVTINKTKTK